MFYDECCVSAQSTAISERKKTSTNEEKQIVAGLRLKDRRGLQESLGRCICDSTFCFCQGFGFRIEGLFIYLFYMNFYSVFLFFACLGRCFSLDSTCGAAAAAASFDETSEGFACSTSCLSITALSLR